MQLKNCKRGHHMASDRSSEADVPTLITDRKEIAEKEAENTLRQFDYSMSELQKWIKNPNYKLRPSLILTLNRYALEEISPYAGVFRPAGINISGSKHEPVEAAEVPAAMEELCDYVNENWGGSTPIHLAAYVMWRLNWIHPFVDGNGRTSRVVSNLVMSAKLGFRLPGQNTIPEQIAANKAPYYKALEDADTHFKIGKVVNVSAMEKLLDAHLARQLVELHGAATGNNHHNSPAAQTSGTSSPPGIKRLISLIETHPAISGGVFVLLATIIAVVFGS
jgi:Fic family protein